MQEFTATHPVELIEALMTHVGYATRTRARNAMKRGEVLVDGKVVFRGSDILEPGMQVSILSKDDVIKRGRTGGARIVGSKKSAPLAMLKSPFPVVYEDEYVFVYEKPAGWVCASPNPKIKTTYSAVKAYLEAKSEERIDVHFVNKLPREASGLLVVAKTMEWRQHLQTHWKSFAKGMYVMIEGHLPADDELFLRPDNDDPYALPYRTMRATNKHTMLKFKAGYDVIKDMLPALRREDCLLIGVGKSVPDPIKRGGIHLFALALKGPKDEVINLKTRVPSEFLKLVRGGSSPKAGPIRTMDERAVKRKREQDGRGNERGGRDDAKSPSTQLTQPKRKKKR